VIIVQADHGPGSRLDWMEPEKTDFRERMSILNALYMPGPQPIPLDSTGTPVNTFRVVFNRYLGTSMPLLADTSRFSTFGALFDYVWMSDQAGAERLFSSTGRKEHGEQE